MEKEYPILKSNRGRPRNRPNQSVVERLMNATELLLQDNSYHDLTERQIAEAAGVNNRMIHYYFENKEGLIFAVIVDYWDKVRNKIKALDTIDPMTPSLTAHICKIMIDAYYDKPWIASIVISEFVQTRSSIKDRFLKRYGTPGSTLSRLTPVFERLIKGGAFDRRLSASFATLSVVSIMVAPLLLIQHPREIDSVLGGPKKNEWIDFVVDLFDRKFRTIETKETTS